MKKSKLKNKKRKFTLIEILIVCTIIAILISFGVAGYSVAMSKSAEAQTISIMKQVAIAMESYKQKYGYYLQSYLGKGDQLPLAPLAEFIPNYEKWKSSGIAATAPSSNDSWINDLYKNDTEILWDSYGSPFWFKSPGYHNRGSFDLESAGHDTIFGYVPNTENKYDWKGGGKTPQQNHSEPVNEEQTVDNISNWDTK